MRLAISACHHYLNHPCPRLQLGDRYSTLRPLALITLPKRSSSARMSAAISFGVVATNEVISQDRRQAR